MKKVNTHKVKIRLAKLVKLAAKKSETLIYKAEVSVIELEAVNKARKSGAWAGKVIIKKDFDALPLDFVKYFK